MRCFCDMTTHAFDSFTHQDSADPMRWIAVIGGSAIAAYGLKMRSWSGLALAAVGGALVWRGAVSICDAHDHDRNVSVPYGHGIGVEESVVVDASAERIYTFWRDVENLPRFMQQLESVEGFSEFRSHWTMRGPLNTKVEWEAEIINDVPNELIAWRTVDCSEVDHAGSVHFTPTADGRTEVRLVLRYDPPGGRVGAHIAKLLGDDPAVQAREDLRRLKALMES
jgi:uncharacterized membrane protein